MIRALTIAGARLFGHDCSQQRILNLLNLEDTPHKTLCAFAIERSRGVCSRSGYTLFSLSTPQLERTALESVHLDTPHNAGGKRYSGGRPFSILTRHGDSVALRSFADHI